MLLSLILLTVLSLVLAAPSPAAEPPTGPDFPPAAIEFFEKEVRPLLASACFECHSRDSKSLKGGLYLDARADVLKGGDTGPAIVAGKPKGSLLIDAINYGETYQMPPKKRLTAEQVAVLTKWVELGAPWPKEAIKVDPKKFDLLARKAIHWCWQPVAAQTPPSVKNGAWTKQPLDQFVLQKLEEKGIAPSPAADKRVLIRRASFDLIGLPPTSAEVEAFLNDPSPQAFEKVVDRLLDSPHFGERWARHWMDLVRYAETYGHEFDYPIPHAAAYRDYLIRAFNANVPYDQFVREQIAGDLLQQPRLNPQDGLNESLIATGFWWFGEATHAPVDVTGDECNRVDNQIDVLSKTFLGVTIACARCHDHKFDAITTKDFYALSGILKSSRRIEAPLDPQGKIRDTLTAMRTAKQTVDQALANAVPTSTSASESRIAKLLLAARESIASEAKDVDLVALKHGVETPALKQWIAALQDSLLKEPTHPLHGWHVVLQEKERKRRAPIFERLRRDLEDAEERTAAYEKISPLFADFEQGKYNGWFTTGEAFGSQPTGAREWDAVTKTTQTARPGVANSGLLGGKPQGALRSPTFTISHKNIHYRLAGDKAQIRVVIDGYFMSGFNGLLFNGTNLKVDKKPDFGWVAQGGDLGRYVGHRAYIEVLDHGDGFVALDEVRFSDGPPPSDIANSLLLKSLREQNVDSVEKLADATARMVSDAARQWQAGNSNSHETTLINSLLKHQLIDDSPATKQLANQLTTANKRLDELTVALPAPRYVLATCDGTGLNDKVHIRGNHRKLGEDAPRRLLEALNMPVGSANELSSGRLQLAEQILDPANPLTARVLVNRVWHHLLGRGIVPSVDNFGVLGQEPSHRELLDYLAHEFRTGGFGSAASSSASTDQSKKPWSIKPLIHSILLSSTYQMSSAPQKSGDEIDPQNLLLHRANIRRLEGEVIRDAILKLSGRLDPAVYGGSVAVHLTPFMQGRGRPGGGPLDGNGRRSLYTEVRRNFLPPMMLAFDAPIPFSSVGARNVSNVPAQALILMNDPLVTQQCDVWAKRLVANKGQTLEQRITAIYQDAFARPPTSDEIAGAAEFLKQQMQELNLPLETLSTSEKVWSDLCHVLVNVKEFIFIN